MNREHRPNGIHLIKACMIPQNRDNEALWGLRIVEHLDSALESRWNDFFHFKQ